MGINSVCSGMLQNGEDVGCHGEMEGDSWASRGQGAEVARYLLLDAVAGGVLVLCLDVLPSAP